MVELPKLQAGLPTPRTGKTSGRNDIPAAIADRDKATRSGTREAPNVMG
jgi:hypothetical protein